MTTITMRTTRKRIDTNQWWLPPLGRNMTFASLRTRKTVVRETPVRLATSRVLSPSAYSAIT